MNYLGAGLPINTTRRSSDNGYVVKADIYLPFGQGRRQRAGGRRFE